MREREVFWQALDVPDPGERAAFLDRAFDGRPELRRQMEHLLQAHAVAGEFLDRPHPAAVSDDHAVVSAGRSAAAMAPGVIIVGKYKLLERIGEGGMGSVWMAEQLEPVKRRVAVKLIRAERDGSGTILSRFEAERQAIALMDHPHIAKLLDAGTTEGDGRPFFVMELVKGIPLTVFCDEQKLSIHDRLDLFVRVCGAVQHAHQKGIIHRDLKPTNILVEMHDDTPVPKVIDFGLAKALSGQRLTDHTLFTAFGTVAGTPLYMAPEQATFNAIDVDTRADVYSLGVVLYELLTGTTPIERGLLKQAALDEVLQVIRESEPPTPSKRLSSTESSPSIAANRRSEPQKLGRFLRGELDWIVMKALAKERDRRYETASGFAKDIERFLNHEPVHAGPPGTRYRLRKFVQRHRGQVIGAASIVLALLLGIVGTTLGLVRAENRRQDAEHAQGQQAEQRAIAVAEQKKAEEAEAQTLADYRAATDDAIEHLIGSKAEIGPQERAYLEKTLKRWEAYAARQGDDERSRSVREEGHFRLGRIWQQLGRAKEARREYELAIELQRKLVEDFPESPRYRRNLAGTRLNLGRLFQELGRKDEAQVAFELARDEFKKLTELLPAEPECQLDLALARYNLGSVLVETAKQDEARAEFEQARELERKLVAQYPSELYYRQELARSCSALAVLLAARGESAAARVEYDRALEIQKHLCEQHPTQPDYRRDLAATHDHLGRLLGQLRRLDEARVEFKRAVSLQTELAEQFPAVPRYREELAHTYVNHGNLLVELGLWDEARPAYQSAREAILKLVNQFPNDRKYRIDLAGNYCNTGVLITQCGSPRDSLEWFDKAIDLLAGLHEAQPHDITVETFLRNCYLGRARAYDRLKQYAEAVKAWSRAIELSEPSRRPKFRVSRATSRLQAGQIAEAIAEVADLTRSAKWSAGQWYDFACLYAVASGKAADHRQAYADRAMELLRTAVRSGFRDAALMAKDTDLDSLRERADFRGLLGELAKPAGTGREVAPLPRAMRS